MFGFSYQFISFLWLYWSYPIVTDVQVTTPTEIDLPAITICDHNGFHAPTYCSESMFEFCFPVENVTDFCFHNPRYCRKGVLRKGVKKFPKESESFERTSYSKASTMKFIAGPEVKIPMCEMQNAIGNETKECRKAVVAPSSNGFMYTKTSCYSLNSLMNQPNSKPAKIASSSGINMLLFVDPTSYLPFIPDELVSMYVHVHSPYALSNPFKKGFNLFPGKRYKFILKERVLKLLPAPYETNCVDYMEEWNEKGTGPISQWDCVEECKMKMFVDKKGCSDFYIWYPNDHDTCAIPCIEDKSCSVEKPAPPSILLAPFTDVCMKKCKPSCEQRTYEIIKQEIMLPEEAFAKVPTRRARRDYIYLKISLDKHEITTYTYSPKFAFVETFSYLGGYIGMWLGISLVAIFDFSETVFAIMKYPFKKTKRSERIPRLQKESRIGAY